MTLKTLLAVGLGGALGSMARYIVVVVATRVVGHGFPVGTLLVNILGSFAMGLLIEGLALRWTVSQELRVLLVVGLLGGFTTFSTFSLDMVTLLQRGQPSMAAYYLLGSVAIGVMGLLAGMGVGRLAWGMGP